MYLNKAKTTIFAEYDEFTVFFRFFTYTQANMQTYFYLKMLTLTDLSYGIFL